MSEKTASLHRAEIEQAIDELVETAILTPWDTREGRYLRLQVHIARTYLAFLDKPKRLEWTPMPAPPKPKTFKPKKPKSHRILKDAGNEVLKAVGKAWSPRSKRKPKPKAKRRTAR